MTSNAHALGNIWGKFASATALFFLPSSSAGLALLDIAWNLDGAVSSSLPPGSTLDRPVGFGTLEFSFASAGPHSGYLFVDHEMSADSNTFFNELGGVGDAPAPAGLSWEIHEPSYSSGNIYTHFVLGTLDNSIGSPGPEDVSMAIGWDFDLTATGTAIMRFSLTASEPSGFHLKHWDPQSGEVVYLSSSLEVIDVPEPRSWGTASAVGLLALALAHRRRKTRVAGGPGGVQGSQKS